MSTMKTLLEQLRVTETELRVRKHLLDFSEEDVDVLTQCRAQVEQRLDTIVDTFYGIQTSNPEIATLIGDADTLDRLQAAQRRYILDLFAGSYDLEYANNRLRIGLVHKRIGVEPKYYLSAVYLLRRLLVENLADLVSEEDQRKRVIKALDKLIYFDVTLVFETYIQSMLSEIEAVKNRTEDYARALEETVAMRTGELRTDSLTGLTTRRFLHEALQRTLKAAERRHEPVSLIFVDVDDFKHLNDDRGHAYGDQVLCELGKVLKEAARGEDTCVRYGGDEFCVVLANSTEEQAMSTYCQRIKRLLAERLPNVNISLGVVQTGPDNYASADALLKHADHRMYQEKTVKKNGLAKH
ncbi:MAG: GGDEF domain-containing protein [Pseudomonadota bacterium]|uniref:GGDEF domain-containing protein n=1 Tax=Alcanivorax sp. TaxID=1872427 RepID=UPI002437CEDE|nr:GGDEF domain-containing protein [Alcanivorax sp.]MEE3320751.1 GGDEF domain-containing protein [Pseudomonadota bacterium]